MFCKELTARSAALVLHTVKERIVQAKQCHSRIFADTGFVSLYREKSICKLVVSFLRGGKVKQGGYVAVVRAAAAQKPLTENVRNLN